MRGLAAVLTLRSAPRVAAERVASLLEGLGHRGGEPEVTQVLAGALGVLAERVSPKTDRTPPRGIGVEGDLAVVADCRLDNREDLCRALDISRDLPDVDVLAAAYRRWGEAVPQQLRGDYAFVVLDGTRRRLFAARDPLAAKPLYYRHAGATFDCATEPAALLAPPDASPRPNLVQVALYLIGEYKEFDATLFEDVFPLPGGHSLAVDSGGARLERFWKPDPWRRCDVDHASAAELVGEAVTRAVTRKLRSAPRVAVFVSGGLDSAIVAAEAERVRRAGTWTGNKPVVVHAAFPRLSDDETMYSDAVADMWELPRVNVDVLGARGSSRQESMIALDVPYDPRNGMWAQLYRETSKRGISVGLTGDGADDCLRETGLEWADAIRKGQLLRIASESEVLRRPWSLVSWKAAVRGLVTAVRPDVTGLESVRRRAHSILSPAYASLVADWVRERSRDIEQRRYPSLVVRELCRYFEQGDAAFAVAVNDRIARRHGVELRHGHLDLDLVELLLALPHDERCVRGSDKAKPVLRRAARDLLPSCVLRRARSGAYGQFFEEVFRRNSRLVHDHAAGGRLMEAGLVRARVGESVASASTKKSSRAASQTQLLRLSEVVAMEAFLRAL